MRNVTRLVAITGLLYLLPNVGFAAIIYVENFVDQNVTNNDPLGLSITGWEGGSGWLNVSEDRLVNPHIETTGSTTPDGDNSYARNGTGDSQAKYATSKAGEFTIMAGDRNGTTTFSADMAISNTNGMKIMAQLDGVWYGSETFGLNAGDHGEIDSDSVDRWEQLSVNADTGTWYKTLDGTRPNAYKWRDSEKFDNDTPLAGLPAGDITQFGAAWRITSNSVYGALDNFQVSIDTVQVPEPGSLALLGLGLMGLGVARRKIKAQ
jgi:hypothetical protein